MIGQQHTLLRSKYAERTRPARIKRGYRPRFAGAFNQASKLSRLAMNR